MSLNALANRIDRGYSIEVRAGELPEEVDDEEAPDDMDEETRRAVKLIASKQAALRFMNLSGKPILELPEEAADTDLTAESEKTID